MILALSVFVGGCAGFHADPMYNHSPRTEKKGAAVSQNPETILWQNLFDNHDVDAEVGKPKTLLRPANLFGDQGAETEMKKPEQKKGGNDHKESSFWRQLKNDLFGPSNDTGTGDDK